ncbi:hypothetical protein [Vulcanisaeta sp. JCM 16161]|uniref:hypothetical protein n=1 Tax=Vulcanisaeta sp. JCM 16161 TaxID=1295372 RepID=UPI001FB289FB|nr:hypothetical protein [Vulcanisaeta sp. JCM 16161]
MIITITGLWIRVRGNGTQYNIDSSVINLLNVGKFDTRSIIDFIIAMFNNAYLFGVPENLRSIYVHGNVSFRRVYGYVMYISRYRSASIHVGARRIRRDFGNCAAYWGWQVLAHEIAHLVGVGGGHYLRHGGIHLSVTKELLLGSLPMEVAISAVCYLLVDYSLGIECKRGYPASLSGQIINELSNSLLIT